MKILGIIPARGGSKSIPLKNIKMINKKTLLSYTVNTAIKSKIFNYIVVSTDHKKIKKISEKFKNVIVFDRAKKISSDNSKTEEAVLDVIKKMKLKKNFSPEWVFILEPTSPLRSKKTILKALSLIKKNKKINSLLTVKKISNTPAKIIKKNRLKYLNKRVSRRQDRKSFYEESGTLYCVKYSYFLKYKKIVEKNPFSFLVPKIEAIDINDSEDFKIAQAIIKLKK